MVTDDFNWLVEHGADVVRDYAGKWIAVCDGKVVGVGETATEAADKARSTVADKPFILEAVESEADVIYADRKTAVGLIIENADAGRPLRGWVDSGTEIRSLNGGLGIRVDCARKRSSISA